MRSASLPLCGAALLLLAAPGGCTKKPLQQLDGGGIGPIGGAGGSGVQINVDGAVGDGAGTADAVGADTGGAIDAAWDAPGGGLLSFNVTSQLQTEAGVGPSHAFTMTLDMRRQIAVIGTPGANQVVPFEQTTGGALRLRPAGGNVVFGVAVTGVCAASAFYSDLTFLVGTPNGLLGTGQGTLAIYDPGLSRSLPATMILTGVVDTEPPTLSLIAGGERSEPWTPLWLVSSEPLSTRQVSPMLVSFGGDVIPLGAPTGMEMYASLFAEPPRMLHFGAEYTISFAGITDLAGNAPASPGIAFNTQSPPPLIVADGFESVTGDTFGRAQVLSGAGAPTISGAISLYIPPAESLGAVGRVTQFAVRVPLPRTATVIRFAYRTVNPGDDFGTYFIVGSEGGTIGTASVSTVPGATTTATIGQAQVMLGPVATATIGLPADASGEVVLGRSAAQPTSCGGPAPQPVPGMIIDDLRAE